MNGRWLEGDDAVPFFFGVLDLIIGISAGSRPSTAGASRERGAGAYMPNQHQTLP